MTPKPKVDGAPGLRWRWRPSEGYWLAMWIAREDIVKRGYEVKTARLWPSTGNVHEPLTDEVKKFLRSESTKLQTEMLAWSKAGDEARLLYDGTINSLIQCYQKDQDSRFQNLRWRSKKNYIRHFKVIEKTVGKSVLPAVKGRNFVHWFKQWSAPKKQGGPRRVPRAHACITMLRLVFSYGIAILDNAAGNEQCARLFAILERMEFENGKPRVEEIVREQAIAIRKRAHEVGQPSIALAQAFMFDTQMRQKDVLGEWVPLDEPGLSDTTWKGQKWLYGIDWREVSDMKLKHRLSKSLKGRDAILDPNAGKVKVFNLRLYPMVMEELALIPEEKRVGPMVVNDTTGLPWVYASWQIAWRAIATDCGIPVNVQNRDTRAGAITETIEVGNLEMAQVGAGHSQISTTQIYSRGDERRTAEVAVLRANIGKTDSRNGN